MKSTIITIFTLSALTISGCGLGTQSILDGPVSTTRIVGPLEFKLELPKRVFKSGESIPIKMAIKNTTDKDIYYGYSCARPVTYGVKNINGDFYWYSGRGALLGNLPPYTGYFPANTESISSWEWLQEQTNIDFFLPALTVPESKIPPGRYFLTGWMSAKVGVRVEKIESSGGSVTLNFPDGDSYPNTMALTEWEAEPIEIEILPPGTP